MNPRAPTGKKAFLEALREYRPDVPIHVVVDMKHPGVQLPGEGAFAVVPLPLDQEQVSFAGVSGVHVSSRGERSYVLLPWASILWMGRDFGTDACVGLSWDARFSHEGKVLKKPRELSALERGHALGWEILRGGKSGPNTVGVA